MKAAIIDALGQLPRFGDFAEPLAEGDEIVVTVTAASIKQLDRAIAAGTHYSSPRELPVIPGTDGVGRLPDGAQVYFAANRRPFGGMAELAPASWTVPLPVGMDDALAAAIVNPALGAWLPIMWRGGLRPGETVVVLGATGGTGRLAVRAARLLGAGRVVAAGRRLEQLAALDTDSRIDLRLPAQELRNRFCGRSGTRHRCGGRLYLGNAVRDVDRRVGKIRPCGRGLARSWRPASVGRRDGGSDDHATLGSAAGLAVEHPWQWDR